MTEIKPGTGSLTKPIKVAMIIQSYYPRLGGAELQIMSLSPYLKDLGVDISIYTRRYGGMSRYEVVEGNPVYRIPAPGPKLIGALSYAIGTLIKLFQHKPDIIHAHELLSPATSAILGKIIINKPVIVKILRGGYLGDIYKIRKGPFSSFRFWLLKNYVDLAISISSEIKMELDEIGYPVEKIISIPNGVDTIKFSPIEDNDKKDLASNLGLPDGQIVIFSGRLVKEKKVDYLIEIWPEILKMYPDANLIILGNGVEKEYLQHLAGEKVTFWGRVDNIHQFLQAGDIFVLPSSTEGLSNSLLEAMSCGLTVIATRIGGALDVIRNNQNGILISPDDKTALIYAILQSLDEPQKRFGIEARKTILRDYSLEQIAKKIFSLYTKFT